MFIVHERLWHLNLIIRCLSESIQFLKQIRLQLYITLHIIQLWFIFLYMYMHNLLWKSHKSNLKKKKEVVVQERSLMKQRGDTIQCPPRWLWAVRHHIKTTMPLLIYIPHLKCPLLFLKSQLKSNLFSEIFSELYLGIFFLALCNISPIVFLLLI